MRGGGPGGGPGQYQQQLTPEQQEELQKKRSEFLNATLKERKALAVKMVELRTLSAQSNPDQAQLKKLSTEVIDLRSQISKKRIEILGDSTQGRGYGRGYGRGQGRGMGGRGGPGMMGGGYGGGYGACWR
jgi:hypothetical protein